MINDQHCPLVNHSPEAEKQIGKFQDQGALPVKELKQAVFGANFNNEQIAAIKFANDHKRSYVTFNAADPQQEVPQQEEHQKKKKRHLKKKVDVHSEEEKPSDVRSEEENYAYEHADSEGFEKDQHFEEEIPNAAADSYNSQEDDYIFSIDPLQSPKEKGTKKCLENPKREECFPAITQLPGIDTQNAVIEIDSEEECKEKVKIEIEKDLEEEKFFFLVIHHLIIMKMLIVKHAQ